MAEGAVGQEAKDVKVWDLFVRVGHWTLAAAFIMAYVTQEELEDLHIAAGYYVGAYVIARTVWGFVGSKYARFSDFVRGPREVFGYLAGIVRGTAPRYLGHNPAGGAMVIALLLGLAGTVFTGLAIEADTENEGPLAPWLGHPAVPQSAPAAVGAPARGEQAEEDEGGEKRESAYEEPHEFFANFTLALVVLHLLGVLASSLAHRENLPRTMITGRKAPLP